MSRSVRSPFPRRLDPAAERSIALLSTLLILVLVTLLVVGLFRTMSVEGQAARRHADRQAALATADWGRDAAISTLRNAIDPVDALTNASPSGFWVSQPGQIVAYHADGSVARAIPLYSPTNAATGTVDLNRPSYTGISPIGGTATEPMPVGWVNVLKDASLPSSSKNPLVARYAYWVDDESSKVNVNTADGTAKGTVASFGEGMPSEISLAALGGTLSGNASRIVSNAWDQGFASESEILRLGVSTNDYEANKLNLTAFSRSPEVNFFGEPKIYLTVAGATFNNGVPFVPTLLATNAMLGPFANSDATHTAWPAGASPSFSPGLPLTQVYPTSGQLPNFTLKKSLFSPASPASTPGYSPPSYGQGTLPQFPFFDCGWDGQGADKNSRNFPLLLRIEQYLMGYNSRGQSVTWPAFGPGGGPASRYTPRQLDSIAIQIVDLLSKSVFPDYYRDWAIPSVTYGPLSGQLVCGTGRGPKITQVLLGVTGSPASTSAGPSLALNFQLYIEWFLPSSFGGDSPMFTSTAVQGPTYGRASGNSWTRSPSNRMTLNSYDAPAATITSAGVITSLAPSPLSTAGAANILNPNDYWMSNMLRITVSGTGADAGIDQFGTDASLKEGDQARAAANHPWTGVVTSGVTNYYGSGSGVAALQVGNPWPIASKQFAAGSYMLSQSYTPAALFLTRPGVTGIDINGGLSIWVPGSFQGGTQEHEFTPLDGLRGPVTGETMTATVASTLVQAVLPVSIQGVTGDGLVHWVHLWVDDPLVNKFPGDWHVDADSSLAGRGTSYTSPDYPGYTASGADPAMLWMPRQSSLVPKTQRFSSIGLLQYVRTGMMPDAGTTNQPEAQLHGAAWRGLDFGGGQAAAYPDWALLDLFTVPAALQAAPGVVSNSPPFRNLTMGGSTAGRINPNGSVLQPWGYLRPAPLAAALQGLSLVSYAAGTATTTTVSSGEAQNLAESVAQYIAANGPLRTAGELAAVPAVSSYFSGKVPGAAPSRNDIVRQTVGLLTPRGNVFSIWVVGQSVKKSFRNTGYGSFEGGDTVTGEARVRYVVERYLDVGMDGVVGNIKNPGAAGIGTWEDAPDSSSASLYYHPSNPAYKYRIIYAQQVSP